MAKLLWDKKTFTVNEQCIQVKGVKVVPLRSLPFPKPLLPIKHSPMVGKNRFKASWIRNQNPRCKISCWLILRRVSESKVIIWLPQAQGQTNELLIILTHLSKTRFLWQNTHTFTEHLLYVTNLEQSISSVSSISVTTQCLLEKQLVGLFDLSRRTHRSPQPSKWSPG